jgi:hypothetical protein
MYICIRNKIGKEYSLEYTKIPKAFLYHITGDDVSRTIKRITNAAVLSKATMISKVIVATM